MDQDSPPPHHVSPPAIVVSDLHLGSPHCRATAFRRFIESAPVPVSLVLNGDTVDTPNRELPASHRTILELLAGNSPINTTVIRGNHDKTDNLLAGYGLPYHDSAAIQAAGLLICHGDEFHNRKSHHSFFITSFHAMHRMRVRLGAAPIHVAQYAKRWRFFYGVLRSAVRENAIQHARENGFRAVACGHVHFAEDVTCDGIRYINTGCWTETPSHFLQIDDAGMSLEAWDS